MRFYLRKVVTYTFTGFALFLIVLNLYNHDLWVYRESPDPPWGRRYVGYDRNIHHFPKFNGKRFHNHTHHIAFSLTKPPPTTTQAPSTRIWMDLNYYDDDRIVAQMRHRPQSVIKLEKEKKKVPLKTILLYHGVGHWNIRHGQNQFTHQKCPVHQCEVTDDRRRIKDADAVMFHHSGGRPWAYRPPNQIWILYMLESPYHTPGLSTYKDVFNWTATYRHDSVIVTPYEKFVRFKENVKTLPQNKSYASGKTRKVAWFVSNCGGRNNRRQYASELAKYISVDIYGACGPLKCPRHHNAQKCFNKLNKDYKFYLSFENSNCRDYITEKFFVNGLQNDVIPIVMGASPEDYKRAAPPHSYIHVDDFETAKDLAEYLHKLDQNDDLFNEYFQWKGTGSFVNTFFWCRLCSMVHEAPNHAPIQYKDLEKWWRGPGICIGSERWRNRPRTSKYIIEDY